MKATGQNRIFVAFIVIHGDGTTTDSYAYGNSVWVDLLTAYNGHAITYDTPGNPTSWYDGAAMTWVNGRRLASIGATSAHGAMSFTYDADGLRLTKTVGGVEHRYLWQNGKLVSEAWGDKYLEFFYDEKGVPLSFLYRSSATADVWKYLYVTNLQGDVIGITTPDGESRAVYTYDPFGKPLTATGTMASVNPLRYRGYYYDKESGLYYVKSRYYDPEICRWISADDASNLGIEGEFVSYNVFVYCGDNPVQREDDGGEFWNVIIGGVVGGLIAGVSTYIQTGDMKKALISGGVGAINGAIAATGMGMLAQAGLSAITAAAGDIATQIMCDETKDGKVDPVRVVKNAAVAGGCSLIGSALGKITSFRYAEAGKSLTEKGKDRLLSAYINKSLGRSYSKLLKQGRSLVARGEILLNTGYGISSVTGSVLTFGIAYEYHID